MSTKRKQAKKTKLPDNVFSLADYRNVVKESVSTGAQSQGKTETNFDQIIEANKRNAERVAKERAQANQSVKHSNRIG